MLDRGEIMPRKAFKFFVAGAIALALCAFSMVKVMKLDGADLKVPLIYGVDALLVETLAKGMIEKGWYWENDAIGAPGGFQMFDFPLADNLHLAVMKLIALAIPDGAAVCNIYYLLTFPLITLSCLCVFRAFQIAYGPAILGSLLFSFLPYHFQRSEAHLFLSGYYLVPPMVMVILWVSRGQVFWHAPRCGVVSRPRHNGVAEEEQQRPRFELLSRRALVSVGICLLVSSAGIYYAFFACYLLLVAGMASCITQRKIQPLAPALVLIAILFVGVYANLYPSYAFWRTHGKNPTVAVRAFQESEVYALKIAQLFLPVSGHRLGYLKDLESRYQQQTSLLNTNDYLGVVGCCGFLLLLARLPRRRSRSAKPSLLDDLLVLTMAAILLATIGGFSSMFSLLVNTSLRCYYRMTIYVAFCALFAVVFRLDRLARRYVRTWQARIPGYAFLAGLLVLGILDQTAGFCYFDYASTKVEYLQDRAFVRALEQTLPPGALVFQLPYKPFPETGFAGTHHLYDYELFRAYLHSKSLRWSYGAMRNREVDRWQGAVVQKPLPQLVETLALAGFSGIYIDRNGFADAGAALEAGLSSLLGSKPLVSENRRLAFFNLTAYRQLLRNRSAGFSGGS
jgi:phosphoglycerol transferase